MLLQNLLLFGQANGKSSQFSCVNDGLRSFERLNEKRKYIINKSRLMRECISTLTCTEAFATRFTCRCSSASKPFEWITLDTRLWPCADAASNVSPNCNSSIFYTAQEKPNQLFPSLSSILSTCIPYRIVADFVRQQEYGACFGNLTKSGVRSLECGICIGQNQIEERQNGDTQTDDVSVNAGDQGLAEGSQGFDEFSEERYQMFNNSVSTQYQL